MKKENAEENAVTGWKMMRENMRQIISDAFTLKNSIDAIMRNGPDQLTSGIAQHEPYYVCQPGRFYTRYGLCGGYLVTQ